MAGSGLLHGTGYIHAVLPWWIGSGVGDHARRGGRLALRQYDAADARRLSRRRARLVRGGDGGGDACSSLIVAHFFPFPIANVVIAFSPGAQDTMMVLALALHLDPVYVGAHHIWRAFLW